MLIKTGLVTRCSSLREKKERNASRKGGRAKKKEDAEVGSSCTRMDRVIQRGFFFHKARILPFPSFSPLFFFYFCNLNASFRLRFARRTFGLCLYFLDYSSSCLDERTNGPTDVVSTKCAWRDRGEWRNVRSGVKTGWWGWKSVVALVEHRR